MLVVINKQLQYTLEGYVRNGEGAIVSEEDPEHSTPYFHIRMTDIAEDMVRHRPMYPAFTSGEFRGSGKRKKPSKVPWEIGVGNLTPRIWRFGAIVSGTGLQVYKRHICLVFQSEISHKTHVSQARLQFSVLGADCGHCTLVIFAAAECGGRDWS